MRPGRRIQGVDDKYAVCRLDPVCDRQEYLHTWLMRRHNDKRQFWKAIKDRSDETEPTGWASFCLVW